jgi:hypothetical protein
VNGKDFRNLVRVEPFWVFDLCGGEGSGPLNGFGGGEAVVEISRGVKPDVAMAMSVVVALNKGGYEPSGIS